MVTFHRRQRKKGGREESERDLCCFTSAELTTRQTNRQTKSTKPAAFSFGQQREVQNKEFSG